jgi:hypothetical protein
MVGLFYLQSKKEKMKRKAVLIASARPGNRLVRKGKEIFLLHPQVVHYPTWNMNLVIDPEKVWTAITTNYFTFTNKNTENGI